MEEVIEFKVFQDLIKVELNEKEDDHKLRFEEFENFLNQFGSKDQVFSDRGAQKLIHDFCDLIKKESTIDSKEELFNDLVKELTAHLRKNPPISLPISEQKRRLKRIKKIKQEIFKLSRKIIKYEERELSLDELDNETNNVLVKIERCQKRIVRLYEELRKLENKPIYFGDDPINFGNLTENEHLDQILKKEIISKFRKDRNEPDFHDINETITKFALDHQQNFDSKAIFKKICIKLKEYNQNQLKSRFSNYLASTKNQDQIVETDELIEKLNSQNKFNQKLDEVIHEFTEKVKKEISDNQNVDSEDSADSESDSIDEEEIDTLSDSVDEFISKEDDLNDDEIDEEDCQFDEALESEITEDLNNQSIESNGTQDVNNLTLNSSTSIEKDNQSVIETKIVTKDEKRKQSDESNEKDSKKFKSLDSDEDCIILD